MVLCMYVDLYYIGPLFHLPRLLTLSLLVQMINQRYGDSANGDNDLDDSIGERDQLMVVIMVIVGLGRICS